MKLIPRKIKTFLHPLRAADFPRGRMPKPMDPEDRAALCDRAARGLVEAFRRHGAASIQIDAHQYRSYYRARLLASSDPAAHELAAALDARLA